MSSQVHPCGRTPKGIVGSWAVASVFVDEKPIRFVAPLDPAYRMVLYAAHNLMQTFQVCS
jgi:hypothetical protein